MSTAKLACQRGRRVRQIDEDVSVPNVAGDGPKGIRGPIEAGDVVHLRRRQQAAVETVGPGVIRALDAAVKGAVMLQAQLRPAMAADVVKGPDRSISRAHDQHARAGDIAPYERAGGGQLIGAPGRHPHLGEHALHLEREPRRIGVGARRQCRP